MTTVPPHELTAAQLAALLKEHGSINQVAIHLGRSRSTMQDQYRRAGVSASTTSDRPKRATIPAITRDMLDEALLPPNNCQVAVLLDAIRDAEQWETLETVEMMLRLPARELPAEQLRTILRGWGFSEQILPDKNHIATHRSCTLPCRCASHAAVKERT